ncbi:MAG: hypothetical protein D6704_09840 [Nitrospirae bacterium]|nr:MAG: hypothetical protein D6704_09840 [Nitrospirota bacterium]
MFHRVVNEARQRGLMISELHIRDNTAVAARIDLFRLNEEHQHSGDDQTSGGSGTLQIQTRGSAGRPTTRLLRRHAASGEDTASELITGVHVMLANEHDNHQWLRLVCGQPRKVVADTGSCPT